MTEPERPEYNPLIMGFVKDRGPLIIPLKNARELYGRLPSEYQLVSRKKGRKLKKALNLELGKIISLRLTFGQENLKRSVIEFFKTWHRNYEAEFGVRTAPLFNLNEPAKVRSAVDANRNLLMRMSRLDLRDELLRFNLIRKDVLNSIPQHRLADTAVQILSRKARHMQPADRAEKLEGNLATIRAYAIMQSLKASIGMPDDGLTRETVDVYADDIAAALDQMAGHVTLNGMNGLRSIRGRGVEFQFAARDGSYLAMGKETGDCTADKRFFQADQDVENIYWTVFPWILDRNYQILKVYFDGDFVMKAHILPLFRLSSQGDRMILAVDAIETARALRDDLEGHRREELIANRGFIFDAVLEEIRLIADRMGIHDVYAEKFSNTPWIRTALARLPEILINVNHLIKLDELEDVYELARQLSRESGHEVDHMFMELQMKNISLLPSVSKRMEGVKSYAVVRGNSSDGIPIKRVIGIT
jgi:hypothetical protein